MKCNREHCTQDDYSGECFLGHGRRGLASCPHWVYSQQNQTRGAMTEDRSSAMDKKGRVTGAHEDADPPSYLPVRDGAPERIPDLCPDEHGRPFMVNSMDPRPAPHDYHNVAATPLTANLIKEDIEHMRAMMRQDDEYKAVCRNAVAAQKTPFYPNGALLLIGQAIRVVVGPDPHFSARVEWLAEHAAVRGHLTGIEEVYYDQIMSYCISRMPVGIGIDIVSEDPHNPETCRDPGCNCYPF